jgi:hypothetical protein
MPIIRSSTAAVAASGFYLCIVTIAVHGCHYDTMVKPGAATVVVELLMMGVSTPETWRAVNKRQDNKLEKLLHLVDDLFELLSEILWLSLSSWKSLIKE